MHLQPLHLHCTSVHTEGTPAHAVCKDSSTKYFLSFEMKSKRRAVTDHSGLVAARPVYPESWCPTPGEEPWHCLQADLIPSSCRMLVGRGSDSGRAVAADPGLQKPAERGAHRLRQSQLVPFTPKALRPATMVIAAKKQRGRRCKRPRPQVFAFPPGSSEARPRAPPPKSCPLSPSPGAPPPPTLGRRSCPPE